MKRKVLQKVGKFAAVSMVCVSLGNPVTALAASKSLQEGVTISNRVLNEFPPIMNGDFNKGLEHWIVSSPGTNNPSLITEEGNNYVKATHGENIHQFLALKPNKTYKFSFDVAGSSSFPAKVEFGTLNQGELFHSLQELACSNEKWEKGEFTFTTPDVENTYIIRFSSTGDGWATFDNIQVYAEDNEAPTAPKNLKASDITESSVKLSWDASTDNVGVASYEIFRDGKNIATVSGKTLSFTDKNLKDNTEYKYTVRAIDEANNVSKQSNEVIATTKEGKDTEAPTVPQNLRLTNVRENVDGDQGEIEIAWDPSSDNVGVTAYKIYVDGKYLATVDGKTTTFIHRNLSDATEYDYQVSAVDAAGNESELSETETGMIIQFQAFLLSGADYLGAIEVGYKGGGSQVPNIGTVYEGRDNWITRVYVPAYGHIQLFDERNYQGEEYAVTNDSSLGRFYNLRGFEKKASSYKASRILGAENLKTKDVQADRVELTWTAPKAEVEVKEYYIYRNSVRVGKVDSNTTSFVDQVLKGKTNYRYTISGVDKNHVPLKTSEVLTVKTK